MGIAERKEKKKMELKQQILDASVKLFSEQGYDGVSIRKIAELIEYSPTTIYLYYKDKTEILFDLHEIGFKKFQAYNQNLADIKNPLVRLHKLGENYLRFGMEYPEYYELMFLLLAPMDFICTLKGCSWHGGDQALCALKETLNECVEKKLIKAGDIDTMAMTFWSLVHGLVALAIRKRFENLLETKDVFPVMQKSLDYMINIVEK